VEIVKNEGITIHYMDTVSADVSVIRAMASSSGREQFLKQFEQIVEGVKQNKTKVSTSCCFSLFSLEQYSWDVVM